MAGTSGGKSPGSVLEDATQIKQQEGPVPTVWAITGKMTRKATPTTLVLVRTIS